ncbi:MAG: diacylglycerol kinase [Gammaproteobacteria bacterium]|nr:diacylglycerol kinase [Gammaproteobacteria bacterium]
MTTNLKQRTGLKRVLFTVVHSGNGFKWLLKNEAAFQQEVALFVPLSGVALMLDISLANQLILICSLLFVLFAELVNTAIEVVVDRIGSEFNTLSGVAKDIGSAAVFISMLMAALIWCAVLWG